MKCELECGRPHRPPPPPPPPPPGERMQRASALPLRLVFSISLAFSFSSLTLSTLSRPPLLSLKSSFVPAAASSPPPSPQFLAADLLALLGSPEDAAKVDADEARELRSCLRYLAPLHPTVSSGRPKKHNWTKDHSLAAVGCVDEMVRWPPEPIMELARLAVDSGGDPAVVQMALDPTPLPVPDVEELKKDKCQLTRTPYAYRFANKELNAYFAFLFEEIAARAPSVGFNVTLNRWECSKTEPFEQMLLSHSKWRHGSYYQLWGAGFHAKEYPAYDNDLFPYNMGYCQTGSNVMYDDSINYRNILWLAPLPSNVTNAWKSPGVLVVLDAHPNGIIYKELIPEYVDYVRTIYEDDFGEVVVDVNYLNVGNTVPGDRIFIC